jgi:Leucine-rich repeat (LRR) protein
MFLPSIMKLDLSFNNIEQIPIEVKRLVNLRIIYLHFNLLRSDTFL